MKPYTIPAEIENVATVSAWLRVYPFMATNTAWLKGLPISERCKRLYPDIVQALQSESMPAVVNLQNKKDSAMSAQNAISGNGLAA